MKFPEKLWDMINTCESGAIAWGLDGKTIMIDYGKFETEFLVGSSGIFKTKNVVSFIRQLNLYGFKKCSRYNDVHEFRNPYFIRGRRDLLRYMRRKLGNTLNITSLPENETASNEEKDDSPVKTKKYSRSASVPGHSRDEDFSYSNSNDVNAFPYNWWGSSYLQHPLNTLFPSNIYSQVKEESSAQKVKEENSNQIEKKEENPYWGNLDMFNNIIFVPVPAHYGLYPGYMNGSVPFPFAMPHPDEKTAKALEISDEENSSGKK